LEDGNASESLMQFLLRFVFFHSLSLPPPPSSPKVADDGGMNEKEK